jgi:acetyl esterase
LEKNLSQHYFHLHYKKNKEGKDIPFFFFFSSLQMTKYKPFPLSPKIIPLLKSISGIEDDDEACQPAVVRKFFDQAAAQFDAAEVERQDREILYNHIKVNISILRPSGSKNKVLPVIMFL